MSIGVQPKKQICRKNYGMEIDLINSMLMAFVLEWIIKSSRWLRRKSAGCAQPSTTKFSMLMEVFYMKYATFVSAPFELAICFCLMRAIVRERSQQSPEMSNRNGNLRSKSHTLKSGYKLLSFISHICAYKISYWNLVNGTSFSGFSHGSQPQSLDGAPRAGAKVTICILLVWPFVTFKCSVW